MKISCIGRCLFCVMLTMLLILPAALAEAPDFSSMSDDEIVKLQEKVNQEIVRRGIEKTAELPAGKYTGGIDLPTGSYILTCKTDESHHGIVWVSAAADDLNNQYPSILYKHIGFSTEEKLRVTIEEGGILNLPFAATLTVSSGLFFK